jgi:hypothetical protein
MAAFLCLDTGSGLQDFQASLNSRDGKAIRSEGGYVLPVSIGGVKPSSLGDSSRNGRSTDAERTPCGFVGVDPNAIDDQVGWRNS